MSTYGCIRTYNESMGRLVELYLRLEKEGKKYTVI